MTGRVTYLLYHPVVIYNLYWFLSYRITLQIVNPIAFYALGLGVVSSSRCTGLSMEVCRSCGVVRCGVWCFGLFRLFLHLGYRT